MHDNTTLPVLIRKSDVPAIYGTSERQIKRWLAEGRLRHVTPSGRTRPVDLHTSDLDQLIEEATAPARRRVKRG